MLRRSILVSLVLLFFTLLAAPSATVSAQTGANRAACGETVGGFLEFPTWYKYLNPRVAPPPEGGGPAECRIDFTFPDDITKVLLAGFEIILRIGSVVAIGFVIFGGFQYIISQGEPERIKNSRTTIINAIVGLVVTIFASAIVSLIGNAIT